VAKAVSGSLGVAGTLVEEILRRAQVDKSTPATRLSDDQIRGIFQVISNLRETVTKGPLFPIVVLDDSRMIDVAPFELELYTDKKKRTFTSFNEAVDEYFTTATSSRQAQERERVYADKKLELQRRLESQKKQLAEIVCSTKVLKDTGDLIFRHLGEIQLALNFVSDARRSKQSLRSVEDILVKEDRSGIRVHPHVQKLSASGDRVTFVFDGEPIEVEVRKRPQDEAAEYYQKAKRLESKLSGLERSIADTETLIQKLTSQEIELTRPARPEPQVEKEWFEKFRWFESSEGVLVVGGRDAASNETLLKRYVGPEDLVMHAEAHGAPFFVVKTETGQPREDTMMETAQACLSYSRLWKEGIHSGDAYWVKPSQVTKSAPAGEYLTKGAFMIRGTRTYLRGVELGLAIGMASRDDKLLMMGGPLKAAKSNCAVFVTISQGKGSPAETARRILTIFKSKADESTRLKLQRIKIDDVIRLLPPGGVDVANSISP
jgi:predicted ribosome quality control (RQC) complex YloA/Tae2 family protein